MSVPPPAVPANRRGPWAPNRWTWMVAGVGAQIPWLLAFAVAVTGQVRWTILGMVAMAVGILYGTVRRNRDFWALCRSDRREVLVAARAGRPTGDTRIDAIAHRSLRQLARSARLDRVGLPVVGLLMVAVPLVAGVRSSLWWFLAALPAVVMLAMSPTFNRSDPRDRLARFEAALAAERPGECGSPM